MHDAGGVRFCQAFSNLLQISQQLSQFGLLTMDLIPQCCSVNKLHRDKVLAVHFSNLIDMRDVWVIERSRGFCFANETSHAFLIRSNFRRQDLQRYLAIKLRVFRQINFTHPAFAKLRADLVAAETCAGCKTHRWRFRSLVQLSTTVISAGLFPSTSRLMRKRWPSAATA